MAFSAALSDSGYEAWRQTVLQNDLAQRTEIDLVII